MRSSLKLVPDGTSVLKRGEDIGYGNEFINEIYAPGKAFY